MHGWRRRIARLLSRGLAEWTLAREALAAGRSAWLDVRNWREPVILGDDAASRDCGWKWSSWLDACRANPRVGGRLLRRALQRHPVRLGCFDAAGHRGEAPARISVVVPCRGLDRLDLCACVLRSFLGQTYPDFEIIVVWDPADGNLPAAWRHPRVRSVPCETCGRPFSRSAFMNVGAREVSTDCVLLHDGDIVVPSDYVGGVVDRLDLGFEAVQPIRLLFYLDEPESRAFLASDGKTLPSCVRDVRQNFAGGSVALRRAAFRAVGGMDEGFAGWGYEDVEFEDRMRTRRCFRGRFAPAIHLWHADRRHALSADNDRRYRAMAEVPVAERIARLRAQDEGMHREQVPGP